MFKVISVQPQSSNGTGEIPTHYQVVGAESKVIFGFPDPDMAQDLCDGLNQAVRDMYRLEARKLAAAAEEAMRVLDKISGSNMVFESRTASNALWKALQVYSCV